MELARSLFVVQKIQQVCGVKPLHSCFLVFHSKRMGRMYNMEIAMNLGIFTVSVTDENRKKVADVLIPVFKGISAKAELFLKEQYAETQNEWYKNKL